MSRSDRGHDVMKKTMRVLVAIGTRPEAIKMMPVIKELKRRKNIDVVCCSTGQHKEMLAQVFNVFDESCDVNLDVMQPGQSLPELTSRILVSMSSIIQEIRPDLILVHGDTTTAMAVALSAFYSNVAIGHVEAGLRSYDLKRPWPEEFNRILVDSISTLMFAPTQRSADNLRAEYNRIGQVFVTGNTGIDALLSVSSRLDTDAALLNRISHDLPSLRKDRRIILVTGHRRESFGDGFDKICDGLTLVASRSDVEIVYPVHLNPNVQGPVLSRLGGKENVHLINPVDYLGMVQLMKRSAVLLTDSGGIQEEGPALGKPVLVMRDVTERPEALETGVVRLVGTDPRSIYENVSELLDDAVYYTQVAKPVFPYGNGTAAVQIVDAIERWSGD